MNGRNETQSCGTPTQLSTAIYAGQHCGLRRCGECSVTTRSKLRAPGGVWRAETGARRTVRTKGRILNIPRYWLAGKWATVQLLRKGAWPVADVAQLLRVGKFQAAECLAFQ